MLYVVLGSVFGLSVLFFISLYIIYRITFRSPHKGQNDVYNLPYGAGFTEFNGEMKRLIGYLSDRTYEEVCVKSFDGLTLYGKYYHATDGAPVYLGFNGYRGTAERDLCGAARIAEITGQNLLIVSQRAHGKSQGHTISFGVKEQYDVLAWVDFCIEKFGKDVKICINGVSMGASTVLFASGLELPKNVFSVVADCPYSAPEDIIKKVLKDMRLPVKIFMPFMRMSARIFGGFSLKGASAIESVKKAKIPILLMHGEADRLVPVQMSEEIAKVNQLVERHTFANAPHGMSYMADEERYLSIVKDFIDRSLDK